MGSSSSCSSLVPRRSIDMRIPGLSNVSMRKPYVCSQFPSHCSRYQFSNLLKSISTYGTSSSGWRSLATWHHTWIVSWNHITNLVPNTLASWVRCLVHYTNMNMRSRDVPHWRILVEVRLTAHVNSVPASATDRWNAGFATLTLAVAEINREAPIWNVNSITGWPCRFASAGCCTLNIYLQWARNPRSANSFHATWICTYKCVTAQEFVQTPFTSLKPDRIPAQKPPRVRAHPSLPKVMQRERRILPECNPPRTHARDSRFETLKNAGEMRFSSWRVQVPPKLDQLPRSLLSRAVVNWRGDFPNASLFDRPVNNARV